MIEVKQEKKALQIQKFSNKKETVSPTLMRIYFLEATIHHHTIFLAINQIQAKVPYLNLLHKMNSNLSFKTIHQQIINEKTKQHYT